MLLRCCTIRTIATSPTLLPGTRLAQRRWAPPPPPNRAMALKLSRVSIADVHGLCTRALTASGLYAESVEAIARTISSAERDGCQSHGLFRLPGYCNALRSGKCSPDARPVVHDAGPAVVRVDACRGPAPYALEVGVDALTKCTRRSGVGVLAVTNAFHFSALWHEVEALAEKGLVGLALLNSKSFVVHHGATRGTEDAMVYGTNPVAFAFPRPDGLPPLLWDQASSAMARGEISMHQQAGAMLPPGCAIDIDGNPTVDPSTALAGAQLTFGQHKGSSISMMVELLTAGLTGGAFSFEAREQDPDHSNATPTCNSELLIAIDPTKVGGLSTDEMYEHCEVLYDRILRTSGTQLPSTGRHCGSQRIAVRERTIAAGVEVPTTLLEEVENLIANPELITNDFLRV